MRYLALLLLFVGEFSVIYAEERGAKFFNSSHDFLATILATLLPLAVGGLSLVIAYMFGMRYFQNIWIITAVSFGSILIVEPLFDFYYIGNVPTVGAGIGFILAVLGIGAALFIP